MLNTLTIKPVLKIDFFISFKRDYKYLWTIKAVYGLAPKNIST